MKNASAAPLYHFLAWIMHILLRQIHWAVQHTTSHVLLQRGMNTGDRTPDMAPTSGTFVPIFQTDVSTDCINYRTL